jgi:hypothetical protein
MFQWFRQMSVIARLRGLAILAVATMLALSSSLLWTSYKQRLADRQTAASQSIELANASVRWAYARQKFGKLDATQARHQTLAVLERLKHGPVAGSTNDVHRAMLSQTAITLGAVALVSGLLWASLEITARDLGGAQAEPPQRAKNRHFPRGPEAYRHGPVSTPQADMHSATLGHPDAGRAQRHAHIDEAGRPGQAGDGEMADALDPNEAAVQEVRRLRMAGAI